MTKRSQIIAITILSATTAAFSQSLAPTPPMGWNSWNCFAKDINEKQIKDIADIMVSSGMRDAGYEYLVLDDAWMDSIRDESGRLQADLEKFPSGMKAIGDYIHSKGLKFGIYECRGYLTCQQLPGSFEHEEIDMQTFADWGVDYIKLDACFAERNGKYRIIHRMDPLFRVSIVILINPFSDFLKDIFASGSSHLTFSGVYPLTATVIT